MKLKINRRRFLELVATVTPAVTKETGVTAGIHLAADDFGRLVATATDYAFTIQAWAECDDVIQAGAIVLPGRLLARILASLPDGAVVVLEASSGDGKGGGVIVCGPARFELAGHPPGEFPDDALEGVEDSGRIEIPRAHLAAGLRATAPFASEDSSRPALCNVNLEIGKGGSFALAATDGHRLGYYEAEIGAKAIGRKIDWLIPAPMAAALVAALARVEDQPWLAIRGRDLWAVVGFTSIRARLSEGAFPEWRRAVPAENSAATVTVERARLCEALRRCLTMAGRDKEGLALVILEIGGDAGIHVEAHGADIGKASDRVDLFSPRRDGHRVRLGVNAGYMLKALDVFTCEKVQVQASDGRDPILISAEAEIGPAHVLMPMRL